RSRRARIDVDRVRADAARRGIRILIPQDPQWPALLNDLQHTAPHCLWVHGPGDLASLTGARTVALVGSRASTPYGEDTAASLAAAFAAGGGTVVSGGAYGIDAAAHRGALAAEDGATLAVLAGGLDASTRAGTPSCSNGSVHGICWSARPRQGPHPPGGASWPVTG